ncbi:presequence protease, mitochondrial [Cloeon dipterum]|uniref:presequence protease, mitochondrial n=1 Tax=Cloeon dipterum TaxID=197152 RepID=UPI00322040F0
MWRLAVGRLGRQVGLRRHSALAGLKGLREGAEVEGFEVLQVTRVPELFLEPVVRLEHAATGAQYLHLARADDRNNAFAAAFRTSPRDSTGLPHILEHVTLCGSQKYPVRDPFFKMLNRSLASFMNAMTGPDYTVYPFSTPNQKDYEQLLSVYADAVFRPLLRDLDFCQEGWRLEHEVVGDPSSPLVLRGVVFNEMKGVFADPQSRLHQHLLSYLLPGDTYAHSYGGEPLCIPALTADDLRRFHARCYHPSNARFVSYGSLPLADTLGRLQREQLAAFDRQEPVAAVSRESRWSQPRRVHLACAPDPLGAATNPEKRSTIAVAYACGDAADVYQTFSLQVLSELLLGGPTSVLHRALIEPGIGDGFAPCTYFEAQTRDTFFSVGLQGVSEKQFDEVQAAIDGALLRARDQGFEQEHVEAVLHSLELGAKTQSASFGLNLALGILPSWNHGADPVDCLNLAAHVSRLRKQLAAEPAFLQTLLDQYLCSNTHKLTISVSPDEAYDEKLAQEEEQVLAEKVAQLDEETTRLVLERETQLQAEQMQEVDASCLPTLSVADLSAEPQAYALKGCRLADKLPLFIFPQPTNGVTHFRALLDASGLDPELREGYLPLLLAVATQMGTASSDYRRFDRRVQLCTSGLAVTGHIVEHPVEAGQYLDAVLLSSVCLDRNVGRMMDLWRELLIEPSFSDAERLQTLIRSTAAELANGLAYSGHRYAMLNASSRLSAAGLRREKDSGLAFVAQMKKFASLDDQGVAQTLQKLQELAASLYRSNLRFSLNVSPGEGEAAALKHLEADLASSLKNAPFERLFVPNEAIQSAGTSSSEHHVRPLPVGYLGRSIATGVPLLHPDYAALRITAQLLSARFLHPEVRERGGAYGGGATISTSGNFTFYSYRDPEASQKTPEVFSRAASWLLDSENIRQEHVDEAKLNVFQKVDAPTAPGDRGAANFLTGLDLEMLQRHRLALKAVSVEDVRRVAAQHLHQRPDRPLTVATTLIGPPAPHLDQSWRVISAP